MWDNAALLRGIANALFGFSVLAALYGAAYYAVHLPGLFPLQSVQLSAAPQRVAAAGVLQILRSETDGNFFTVDLEHVRQSLEKLPWVRSVSIRREFPHRLVVQLEEHQALARWNNAALVNQHGEVFFVNKDSAAASDQPLPNFTGPDGTSAEVTQRYAQFSRQIAPLNWQAVQLALSARHAWQLRLDNGMVVELGREDMQQRLARFVAAQGTVDLSRMKYVDLRYRNGFAVRQGDRG
jgi:cell division protein FtsQ